MKQHKTTQTVDNMTCLLNLIEVSI